MQLLVTGAWKFTPEDILKIEKLDHSILYLSDEEDKLPDFADCVEGIICNGLFLYHPIEYFTNLRYIQLTSVGLDRVPLEHIKKKGITIKNAIGVYSIPIAESVTCNVLNLYRRSAFFYENQKQHVWEKCRDLKELFGKTVCIVGCGSIGTKCLVWINIHIVQIIMI